MPYAVPVHRMQPPEMRSHMTDGFYSLARWRKVRQIFLGRNPLCSECEARGLTIAASDVDHVIPRRERPDLAFTESNLRALCKACHSRKTMGGH